MKIRIIILLCLVFSFRNEAQVLSTFTPYRNVTYVSAGVNNSFANTTIGIARVDYVKLVRKQVIGLLDISLPITNKYFTRRSVRKGFQFDIINKDNFRVPLLIASSSIFRESKFYKVHDVTLEVAFSPSFSKGKYYFALDLRYEFILFRHYKYSQLYLNEINPTAKSHWEQPNNSIGKAGIVCGVDLKKWFFQFKCGYEKYPSAIHQLIPAYVVLGGGFKFGSKSMKNNSSTELH